MLKGQCPEILDLGFFPTVSNWGKCSNRKSFYILFRLTRVAMKKCFEIPRTQELMHRSLF
jgi:hypothetical protein